MPRCQQQREQQQQNDKRRTKQERSAIKKHQIKNNRFEAEILV
jgi:hypothetical protein